MVEALLRVAGVTAGLAESKDSLLPGLWITYRLTAKNYDQHRNPTLSNQVWATFFLVFCAQFAYAIRYHFSNVTPRTNGP